MEIVHIYAAWIGIRVCDEELLRMGLTLTVSLLLDIHPL